MSYLSVINQLENIGDPTAFFEQLGAAITKGHHADYAEVIWVDAPRQHCVTIASNLIRYHGKPAATLTWSLDDGLYSLVYQRKEACLFTHLSADPRLQSLTHHVPDAIEHAVIMPIMYRHKMRGMLACYREHKSFDGEDVAMLMTFGVKITGAFYRRLSRLQEELVMGHAPAMHEQTMTGTPCAPGVAMGKVVVVSPPADLDAVVIQPAEDVSAEVAALTEAVAQVKQDINHLSAVLSKTLPNTETDIFSAYCHMIDRHGLVRDVTACVHAEGCTASGALKMVIDGYMQTFEKMDDPYLRARMIDVKDIGRRILSYLYSAGRHTKKFPKRTILAGYDLAPMAIAEVPEGQLVGVFCARGSRHSHASILARAIGVPTVVGIQDLVLQGLEGNVVLLDGYTGQLVLHPSEQRRRDFTKLIAQEVASEHQYEDCRGVPAATKDGVRIALHVNVGLGTDIHGALKVGADGIGLFRTEIPFMMRPHLPSETEQCSIYRQILKAFAPKPVVLRTIDVGGDKHLPYWHVEETNPYLGWRGVRLCLDQEHVLRMQLRAMLLASEALGPANIMIPMISDLSEIKAIHHIIEAIHQSLLQAGHPIMKPKLGMMIEVPSVICLLPKLAQHVDFFSVGTNDLTQYLLAVDRNNHRVAHLYDYWHPAVLHALMTIVDTCRVLQKPVSVCGEMAGDPMLALLLVAMGYQQLSMSPKSLPKMRWVLRHFTLAKTKSLLDAVMQHACQKDAQAVVKNALREAGLARLIGEHAHQPVAMMSEL